MRVRRGASADAGRDHHPAGRGAGRARRDASRRHRRVGVAGGVDFDADLARRIAVDHEDGDWPVMPTQAGHDAGILSTQGIPSAMLFVRNPTGVSHSPAEHAETAGLSRRGRRAGRDAGTARLVSDPTAYLLERAWVDGAVHDGVRVEIEDGRFSSVDLPGPSRRLWGVASASNHQFHRVSGETVELPGLTIPGLANCHSHAFHRALRGRTQRERGSSGPGASRCTTWRRGSTRTPTSSWRRSPTARWWPPGSRPWGSSTTSTTSRTARRTTSRTRWVTRSSRRRHKPD